MTVVFVFADPSMFIVGGYLITYAQLAQIGERRGISIPDGEADILNRSLREKGYESIFALPVDWPRRTETTRGRPMILIASRKRHDYLIHLADCVPFEENEDDLKVKGWLAFNGITDAPFTTIPDPLCKYNENGYEMD
ncbi:hypothetical protein SCP_1102300 [Sparassis crispa]|uniref:Uncharacterized protein n=1 Tax=Sparassis crispa TaxID=139825 RepID=A0A401GZG3_9APHY|nr:hypothetical protein SCP_1102300 [Sparassis crispa]GBE87553.1 hypothetical protein SCP_1102300 [Sparassis crispa]